MYRLDAFLAHRGFGTRSTVRDIIRSGRVRVDGAVVRLFGHHLRGGEVMVDGTVVPVGRFDATLLLHKPVGVACSHDPAEEPLVYGLIPAEFAALPLESAGRLDRQTSGLLVLSTDGQLIHRLTNPKRHLPKRYRIGYTGSLGSHAVERVAQGIRLDDDPKPTLPAELILAGGGPDGLSQATMILAEGRHHQVRRMIAALGGSVETLSRDRIGTLDLPADLAPGGIREITAAELAALQQDDRRPPGGLAASTAP